MKNHILMPTSRTGRPIDMSALKDLLEPVDLEALETKHVQAAAKDVDALVEKLKAAGKIPTRLATDKVS